jgi:long-subunit acyl-CoA synthetase (AMP-forming)
VAVVVPDEEALREWAKLKNITVSGSGLAPFLAMPQVKSMIFAEMQAVAKAGKVIISQP